MKLTLTKKEKIFFPFLIFLLTFNFLIPKGTADFDKYTKEKVEKLKNLPVLNQDSAISFPSAQTKFRVKTKILMVITAYSSTPWQTDNTPFITASGTWVRDGIVANNLLPFGTKVRIPSLFGDKIFVVEDRMNPRKGPYSLDIWLPSYKEAKNFGATTTLVEILK